jgi:hypothetical protein
MRVTLTLDVDLSEALQREMRRSGIKSLKAALNHFLRLGLKISEEEGRKAFVVHPRLMGLPAGLSYDCVEELLKALEGDGQD